MQPDLDLRDSPRADHRERISSALDDAESGEPIDVVADYDPDVLLDRYRIEAGRELDWAVERNGDDEWMARVTKGEPLGDELVAFDVRELPPQRRHEVLLETFDELDPGQGFVLVNDHDPKPLSHELRSTRGDTFDWEYRSRGDDGWRVAIRKTEPSEAPDDDIITRYDVRAIPKAERHPSIHHRYGMIPTGATMEIVAPHEPRPLHREFRQRYGETFTWAVVENEGNRCRVQITKEDDAGESSGEVASSEGCKHDTASGGDQSTSAGEDPATGAEEENISVTQELDVRDLPPAKRHELIFETYDELERGQAFVLVNDHDPKPLYHQFEAEAGDEFRWEYRQKAAGEFRVLVGKATPDDSRSIDGPAEAPF